MFSSGKTREKSSDLYLRLENTGDLDPLLESIGNAKYVLLGEASHGTHEYYTWRAEISKRLIKEKGFSFIAVEGDWPDCYKINHWIKGNGKKSESIKSVLSQFKRWPTWMWANWEIAAFAVWLRNHNDPLTYNNKVGFYGLDVYSLWESMDLIVEYLEKEDPSTAELAKAAFTCFEPYKTGDSYGSLFSSAKKGCKEEVIKLLREVRENAHKYKDEREADLNAEINALVVANAEKYYKSMAGFGEDSWNVRDRHMVETLNILSDYHKEDAKVIIWEHNTHIGDARATNMANSGLVNVGQLIREQHAGKGVFLAGFGSHSGSVIAGNHWGGNMRRMQVPEAIASSVEYKLHEEGKGNKLLLFHENEELEREFSGTIGHRAIGVIYNPERERGNYVPTRLSQRYDAFLFIDKTSALHPLKIDPDGELTPDTYPFGI